MGNFSFSYKYPIIKAKNNCEYCNTENNVGSK